MQQVLKVLMVLKEMLVLKVMLEHRETLVLKVMLVLKEQVVQAFFQPLHQIQVVLQQVSCILIPVIKELKFIMELLGKIQT